VRSCGDRCGVRPCGDRCGVRKGNGEGLRGEGLASGDALGGGDPLGGRVSSAIGDRSGIGDAATRPGVAGMQVEPYDPELCALSSTS
jgi:hypothetical protein